MKRDIYTDRQYRTFDFEVKSANDETGEFEGYGAVFGNIDRSGDIIVQGAFIEAIPDFLKDGIIAFNHDWDNPIGSPLECYEDGMGLFIKGSISATSVGKDVRILLKDKVVKKQSIGYNVAKAEKITPENIGDYVSDLSSVEPKSLERAFSWGYILQKIKPLYECGPVSVPANNSTTVSRVKAFLQGTKLLDDHFEFLLDGNADLVERLSNLREKRGQLSDEKREKLIQISRQIDELIKATAPAADPDAVRFLSARMIEQRAREMSLIGDSK